MGRKGEGIVPRHGGNVSCRSDTEEAQGGESVVHAGTGFGGASGGAHGPWYAGRKGEHALRSRLLPCERRP